MKIDKFFNIVKKKLRILGVKDLDASEYEASDIAQKICNLKKGGSEAEKTLVFDACAHNRMAEYVFFDDRPSRQKYKKRGF